MFWNSKDASIFLSGPDTKTRAQGRTIGSKYFAQRATSLAQHFIPNGSKLKMKTPNGFLGTNRSKSFHATLNSEILFFFLPPTSSSTFVEAWAFWKPGNR